MTLDLRHLVKNIVLLNGPPRSGKDTLANQLVERFGFRHFKITAKWKERVHALYGLDPKQYPHDFFEKVKDEPNALFHGSSPRRAYIDVWENYFKHAHGEEVLMDWLINEIDNCEDHLIVISDVGFDREAKYLFEYYGKQALLIKVFRNGYTFAGDSRDYVKRDSAKTYLAKDRVDYRYGNVYNNKTPEDMVTEFKLVFGAGFTTPLIEK